MYELILFDLDGTLTDSGKGIINSVEYALNKYSIGVKDKTTLKKFIGPPLAESFMKYYGFTADEATDVIECYREYYRTKGIFENEVYPKIEEMLKTLTQNGKKVALATSKPEIFAKQILDYFNLSQYFSFIGGSFLNGQRTDKAQVISYVLENFKDIPKDRTVMVGDREHDILGAQKNEIDSIGVLFGYGSRKELEEANATHICENAENIIKVIL